MQRIRILMNLDYDLHMQVTLNVRFGTGFWMVLRCCNHDHKESWTTCHETWLGSHRNRQPGNLENMCPKKKYCDRPYQLRLSWQLTTPFNWQITRVQGSHHPFQLVGTHSCRLVSKCLIVISHAVHSRILILQQKSFRLANSTIMIPAIHCPEHEQSVHKLYLREVWKRTLPCLFPAHGSTQKR